MFRAGKAYLLVAACPTAFQLLRPQTDCVSLRLALRRRLCDVLSDFYAVAHNCDMGAISDDTRCALLALTIFLVV